MLIAGLDGEEKRALLVLMCVLSAPESTKAPSPSMVIGRCYLLSLCVTGKVILGFVLLHLLLLLSGDVETNPGPITGERVSFADAHFDYLTDDDTHTFLYQNRQRQGI